MAYHWAELAWVAAYESPGLPADTAALTRAEMANALRAGGDLAAADRIFEHVRQLVEHGPVRDLFILARTLHEGSLRKDLRQFATAQKLLERSSWLSQLIGDEEGRLRVLMTLADTLFYQGEVGLALVLSRRILDKIPARLSKLRLWSRHNFACYLAADGQLEEAALLRAEDGPLCEDSSEAVERIRLDWLDARIASGRGRSEEAAALFTAAQEGFLAMGIARGAILVAADLAHLYCEMGRSDQARSLARSVAAQEIVSMDADPRALEPLKPFLACESGTYSPLPT